MRIQHVRLWDVFRLLIPLVPPILSSSTHSNNNNGDIHLQTHHHSILLASTPTVSVVYDQTSDLTVVTPASHDATLEILQDYLESHRETIQNQVLFQKGGLLLRGWPVSNVTTAEDLIFQSLELPTMELYPKTFVDFNLRARDLNVLPSGGLTQTTLSRNVPPVRDNNMQPPHVEFGLGPYRPRVVGFYAEIPPAVDGATGRVCFPEAVRRLSSELYLLLNENGWWTPQSRVVQPALLVHPETGLETLQLYSFSKSLASVALEAYQDVRKTERPDLPEVLEIPVAETDSNFDYTMSLVRPNGTIFEVPRYLQVEYYRAIFSTLRFLEWQKHDLLLFDNVLYGHMRMPGRPPRALHAIFACELDTRQLRKATAPKCVQEGAKQTAFGSIQVMLDQLGPGGNMWVLWSMNLLPDVLFQICGNLFWADGGGAGAWNVAMEWLWGEKNTRKTREEL